MVIDARGPVVDAGPRPRCGFLKFLGLDVRLAAAAAACTPAAILMDATVPQRDIPLLYVLPLRPTACSSRQLLFGQPRLRAAAALRTARSLAYAKSKGWTVEKILREESGILPLPFRASRPRSSADRCAFGYKGGWFHPATSFSFPIALRLADYVATVAPASCSDPVCKPSSCASTAASRRSATA